MSETEQLRLGADLLTVMRAAVTVASLHGASFVAPPHIMIALLGDALVGPAIAPLVPGEAIARAAEDAVKKLPAISEGIDDRGLDEEPPYKRYESLAFRATDGSRSLYLDADAYRVFVEGARRAETVYRAKHIVYGLVAEAVKDPGLLRLFGSDPDGVMKAIDAL